MASLLPISRLSSFPSLFSRASAEPASRAANHYHTWCPGAKTYIYIYDRQFRCRERQENKGIFAVLLFGNVYWQTGKNPANKSRPCMDRGRASPKSLACSSKRRAGSSPPAPATIACSVLEVEGAENETAAANRGKDFPEVFKGNASYFLLFYWVSHDPHHHMIIAVA